MNDKTKNQRMAFDYLSERFKSRIPFTRDELKLASGWTEGTTFNTYFSKHFRSLLVSAGSDTYRVSDAFRPFATWESFQLYVTQVRRASSDYTSLIYNHVVIYEFFMPLTNEGHLRTALDALFYEDTIVSRLKTIDRAKLISKIPIEEGESDENYLDRVCGWISDRFGGYSISHVNGRFRADSLATYERAAHLQANGARYLVDETTAVVKFIFHCGEPIKKSPPLSAFHFEEEIDLSEDAGHDAAAIAEATAIRWFFGVLFVQSMVQVINGEDEIWMVESGIRSRLHIWRVEDRANY